MCEKLMLNDCGGEKRKVVMSPVPKSQMVSIGHVARWFARLLHTLIHPIHATTLFFESYRNIFLKQKERNEVTPKLLGKATGSLDGWIVGQ